MTTGEKIARRKLCLLDVATVMGNVSKSFEIMLYSRQPFYEIRRNDQSFGSERLLNRLLRSKSPHCTRVGELEETSILSYSLSHPTHSLHGAAQNLVYSGIQISSGGVRGVWSRHILLTRHERLLRLEQRFVNKYWNFPKHKCRFWSATAGVSGPPHQGGTYRLPGCRGHVHGRQPQRRRTDICAVGHRLPQLQCLWAAVHQQAAGDGDACAQRGRFVFFEEHSARIESIISNNAREFCCRSDWHF